MEGVNFVARNSIISLYFTRHRPSNFTDISFSVSLQNVVYRYTLPVNCARFMVFVANAVRSTHFQLEKFKGNLPFKRRN